MITMLSSCLIVEPSCLESATAPPYKSSEFLTKQKLAFNVGIKDPNRVRVLYVKVAELQ